MRRGLLDLPRGPLAALLGAVRLRDVEKAQQEVVGIARKMEEEGMITTGGGAAGDSYVS